MKAGNRLLFIAGCIVAMAAARLALHAATTAPRLITVSISPEARVKADSGDAPRGMTQGKWQDFTVKIENAAGITAPLRVESAQSMSGAQDPRRDHWLRMELVPPGPLTGAAEEERTLRLWSRDAGTRVAVLNFDAGQGTQDLGFRSDVLLSFKVEPVEPNRAVEAGAARGRPARGQ